MSLAVAATQQGAAIAEKLIVQNDLSRLNQSERIQWYRAKCQYLGLDWRLAPFDYLNLKGALKLYLNASGAEMLRKQQHISITDARWEFVQNLCVATVVGRTPDGREDREIGAVSIRGLTGEELANAPMKAYTKAKRRLVLSMGGLGADDDTEMTPVEDVIPAAKMVAPVAVPERPTLPDAPPVVTMRRNRLTPDQQEAMFNEAARRLVGGIMPVDVEQEPSTQTWHQVIEAVTAAYERIREKEKEDGFEVQTVVPTMAARDGRVSPGKVYKALVDLPEVVPATEDAGTEEGEG